MQDSDTVTRFIYSKSNFSKTKNRAKPNAFSPFPHDELSTAHITALADDSVWTLATAALGQEAGRGAIYARADISVGEISKQHLKAIRDDDPFVRHTVVKGWPVLSDPAERKAQWLEIALVLSQQAALVAPGSPILADRTGR